MVLKHHLGVEGEFSCLHHSGFLAFTVQTENVSVGGVYVLEFALVSEVLSSGMINCLSILQYVAELSSESVNFHYYLAGHFKSGC